MSRELHELNRQIKEERTPELGDRDISGIDDRSDLKFDNMLKNRRLACTWCRQQKSKCDAREHFPNPCSRCQKKGLSCQLKPDFKRTQKRARIALIEKEFAELKRSFMSPLSAEIVKIVPALCTEGTPISVSPQPGFIQIPRQGSPFDILVSNHSSMPALEQPIRPPSRAASSEPHKDQIPDVALLCEEKSLDSVTLDPDTIRLLFMEYVRHYHVILPVVDVLKGPERIYRLCPALFWVIMFVGLRRYDDNKSLLLELSPLIKGILAEITISPITRYNPIEEDEPIMNASSVYSVQAFILYTLWPPLTSSLSADSSWNTIGVALFQAIRIGLHSSSQILEEDEKNEKSSRQNSLAQEHLKTWITCNIVSQNIATAFGFPAFVQFDSLRAHYADIPLSTRQNMEIAHFEDQVAKTLNLNSTTDTGLTHVNERLALMKVLIRQLDELEIKLTFESADEYGYRKFLYIVARIHLLTHYFLDASKIPLFELSKGLVRLYNAAISLIDHTEMCQAKNKDFMKYLPVVSILNLWQASCIIVKLANSPFKSVIDVDSGKQIYLNAISLVARASILKHDMAYRASGIMRNMWQLFRTLDEKGLTSLSIKIRSRMAASVFFDCMSLLRDQVGMAKLNFRTDTRDNAAEEYQDEEELYERDNLSGEEAVESSEEENRSNEPMSSEHRSVGSASQKSTPGSSNSSRVRKKRSLSGLQDAESKARRIIRTIPLDPQPISASKRSSIFKVVNTSTDTLPSVANDTEDCRGLISPGSKSGAGMLPPNRGVVNHASVDIAANTMQDAQHNQSNVLNAMEPIAPKTVNEVLLDYKESPSRGIVANLEEDIFEMSNDSLWKDVDSLMNDFGFHT